MLARKIRMNLITWKLMNWLSAPPMFPWDQDALDQCCFLHLACFPFSVEWLLDTGERSSGVWTPDISRQPCYIGQYLANQFIRSLRFLTRDLKASSGIIASQPSIIVSFSNLTIDLTLPSKLIKESIHTFAGFIIKIKMFSLLCTQSGTSVQSKNCHFVDIEGFHDH